VFGAVVRATRQWLTCSVSHKRLLRTPPPDITSTVTCHVAIAIASLTTTLNWSAAAHQGMRADTRSAQGYFIVSTVWVKKIPPPLIFFWHFSKTARIFSPNFTCLLHVPICARLQIFIQLSATLTKLRHIKRSHHYMLKMSTIGWNACWGGRTLYGITLSQLEIIG